MLTESRVKCLSEALRHLVIASEMIDEALENLTHPIMSRALHTAWLASPVVESVCTMMRASVRSTSEERKKEKEKESCSKDSGGSRS